MIKIDALIPARGGSKGVLKKNIKKLSGHPLIAYSIEICKRSKLIDKVYVSTDDEEIAKVAEQYGAIVPFIRPTKYSQDNSTDNEVLNHYFDHIEGDEVAFIRPTTPLRESSVVNQCIEEYFNKNIDKCSGIRSVHVLPESPYKMYRLDDEGYCTGFFRHFEGNTNYTNLPRQRFPNAYHPNGYIDIIKKEWVRNKNTFGDKVMPFITDFSIEIDTQEQFDILGLKIEKEKYSLTGE